MRALLIALVAANLLLFAWGQGWFTRSVSADAVRLQQQVNADKLRICTLVTAAGSARKVYTGLKPPAASPTR